MYGRRARCRLWAATIVLLSVVVAAPVPAAAAGGRSQTATATVTVGAYRLDVPRSWPTVDLARDTGACYRVDRHAAYIGHPSGGCSPHLAGRTETVLVEPLDTATTQERPVTATARAGQVPTVPPLAETTHELRVEVTDASVVVTVTWGDHFDVVKAVLASGRLVGSPPTAGGSGGSIPRMAPELRSATPQPDATANATAGATAAVPQTLAGQVLTGPGFDACSLPPADKMGALRSLTGWRWAGFYLGGSNAACPSTRLGTSWVTATINAGWGLAPIWVGRQAPNFTCSSCAKIYGPRAFLEGIAEADAAVTVARSVGMGPTVPIYYDMEAYTPGGSTTTAVLTFFSGWRDELHRLGYTAGVYSSAGSGIADLVNSYNSTTYHRPDVIWIAHWDGVYGTGDAYVPSNMWANHQRLRQYASPSSPAGHTTHPITVSGYTFEYDADAGDGVVATGGAVRYIKFLYQAILGRLPDSKTLAYRAGLLGKGVSRATEVSDLVYSAEAMRRVVALDYTSLLGRAPDPEGTNYWAFLLAVSHRNDLLRAYLVGSSEYYGRAGSTPSGFVNQAYRDLLGRSPDPAGLSYWIAQIAAGHPRTELAAALVDSTEASRRDVNGVFLQFLHRPIDSAGLAYYVPTYRSHFDLFPVEVAVGSSLECWAVAQLA